jgi:thiamine biosynthesis protein ThiS
MQIVVNGAPREINSGLSVAGLLEELKIEPKHVAVEVNLELVPRARHAERLLTPGDRLEVVTLVGGG